MKLYISTKWEQRGLATGLMRYAEHHGHSITYDWTVCDIESPTGAAMDIIGVITADLLIILAEQELPYRGVYVELGAALGCHIPVWLVGHGLDACLFAKHPLVKRFSSMASIEPLLAYSEVKA